MMAHINLNPLIGAAVVSIIDTFQEIDHQQVVLRSLSSRMFNATYIVNKLNQVVKFMMIFTLDRIFLSTVLLVASISKLINVKIFRVSLKELQLNSAASYFFSWGIPVLEIVTATLLLFNYPFLSVGEVALFILLGGFSWSVWKAYKIGNDIKCNCFGNLVNEKIGLNTLLKVLLMGLLNIYLIVEHDSFQDIIHLPLLEILRMIYSSIYVLLIYSMLTTLFTKSSSPPLSR